MDDTSLTALHRADTGSFVDIVFVHGLKGDPKDTWQGCNAEGAATYWPDWVVADLPGARVWCAGYPSTLSNWEGRTLPIASLANNLAHRLRSKRNGQSKVVWVGHSMGGLIIKHILCDAAISSNTDIRQLWRDTRAVMFLGTPHSGSDLASLKLFLSRLLEPAAQLAAAATGAHLVAGAVAVLAGVRRVFGGALKPVPNIDELHANATALAALNQSFQQHVTNRLAEGAGLSIVAYRETQALYGAMVVDLHSANPNIPQAEVVDLPADHASICKPASREAAPHCWLLAQVSRMRSAPLLTAAVPRPAGRVFLSYLEPDAAVFELVRWLRQQGVEVDVDLDFFGRRAPEGGWKHWARRCVAEADTVLFVGHARYPAVFNGSDFQAAEHDLGRAVVTHEIYVQPGVSPDKFIPLLKDGDPTNHLPVELRDWWSGMRFPSGREALLAALSPPSVSRASHQLKFNTLPTEASS